MIVHTEFQVHTKCLTYLPWPLCLKKPSGFMESVHPSKGTNFHSSEKWKILIKVSWDNADNSWKNFFSCLKERSQRYIIKVIKGVYTPHKSLPTNFRSLLINSNFSSEIICIKRGCWYKSSGPLANEYFKLSFR